MRLLFHSPGEDFEFVDIGDAYICANLKTIKAASISLTELDNRFWGRCMNLYYMDSMLPPETPRVA